MTTRHGPMLDPAVAVLRRPGGAIQLGVDQEYALLLTPKDVEIEAVLGFLRLLDGLRSRPEIIWRAGEYGLEPGRAVALLTEIDAAGLLVHPEPPAAHIRAIHVHGLGPLSDALGNGLRRLGLRPTRSRDFDPEIRVDTWQSDLVVLTDTVVPDPRLVADLLRYRIPHLQVRMRAPKGVVGPLVLPGATSCLRCADLTRCEYDAAWPHLAAQLLNRVGYASHSGIAATAALALRELEAILRCSPQQEPDTLDATLELDLCSHQVHLRRWERNPACECRIVSAVPA
ncbi:hypothetical protein D5S18_01075 [Nocardia panacis]|uniref:TOMM leader peptide-binding protein n=1 Tax=Nocardia panacis TaxID=2340916 RepID=A0A3A4L9E7_9NOCA|nr:hypothetical protein [Nocardia panacis]RJO79892.1 hypothetical protein D5S18_01075 [Nocardia panacis]